MKTTRLNGVLADLMCALSWSEAYRDRDNAHIKSADNPLKRAVSISISKARSKAVNQIVTSNNNTAGSLGLCASSAKSTFLVINLELTCKTYKQLIIENQQLYNHYLVLTLSIFYQ